MKNTYHNTLLLLGIITLSINLVVPKNTYPKNRRMINIDGTPRKVQRFFSHYEHILLTRLGDIFADW